VDDASTAGRGHPDHRQDAAPRPVLIYDGDCGICTRLVGLAGRLLRPTAWLRAAQQLDLAVYGLTADECDRALQFVAADGRVYAAQDAVSQLLLHSGGIWRPVGLALRLPGVNALAGVVYRWVARNRYRLPGGTAACAVAPKPASDGGSRPGQG
jgi:predicted DCC family thiol-disulfide oxidoreductase YuxK